MLIRIVALTALLSSVAFAQVTTATLYGVARDASGSLAPNARITATSQATGARRDASSDATGEFALAALPTGRYTLRFELAGFKTYVNEGLDLNAGQIARQTFTLEVGQVSENVTV
jgi:hypothetical protein